VDLVGLTRPEHAGTHHNWNDSHNGSHSLLANADEEEVKLSPNA
jgi:hypothetical protein